MSNKTKSIPRNRELFTGKLPCRIVETDMTWFKKSDNVDSHLFMPYRGK